jgi:hypothetical protein
MAILHKFSHFEEICDRRDTGTLALSAYPELTP